MSLTETHTLTQPDQESAVVGMPCADAEPQRFPSNILSSQLMTLPDIESLLAMPVPQPKGEAAPQFSAKANWLPVNEQLAVQLGHAQAALRLLDDQRALVTGVQVYADLILIDLVRAPDERKALWQHIEAEGQRMVVTADLAGANETVLLRWPLEHSA